MPEREIRLGRMGPVLLVVVVVSVLLSVAAAVALTAAWVRRRRLRRQQRAFPCKLRLVAGTFPGVPTGYRRGSSTAVWVHDVLVVHSGFLRDHVVMLPTLWAEGVTRTAHGVSRLGSAPIAVVLLLDSGTRVALAAPDRVRALLPGPYEVAHAAAANETLTL